MTGDRNISSDLVSLMITVLFATHMFKIHVSIEILYASIFSFFFLLVNLRDDNKTMTVTMTVGTNNVD